MTRRQLLSALAAIGLARSPATDAACADLLRLRDAEQRGPRPTGKRYCNSGVALKFEPQGA